MLPGQGSYSRIEYYQVSEGDFTNLAIVTLAAFAELVNPGAQSCPNSSSPSDLCYGSEILSELASASCRLEADMWPLAQYM